MLAKGGLRYGIDFSGGTLIQVRFDKPVSVDGVRRALESSAGQSGHPGVRGHPGVPAPAAPAAETPEQVTRAARTPSPRSPAAKHEVRRVEFVGPQVGSDLQVQAIYAVLGSMAGILIYVAIRFDFSGGLASVAAIVHDVDLPVGHVPDQPGDVPRRPGRPADHHRLLGQRHHRGLRPGPGEPGQEAPGADLRDPVNDAINQTLSRTVLTSLTVFLSAPSCSSSGARSWRIWPSRSSSGSSPGTFSTISSPDP